MAKLRVNDKVIVIAGKDKGREGIITKIISDTGKVLVGGLNLAKKHVKPNPQKNIQGGIVEMEMPLNASNVALFNPTTEKADRVGYKIEDGKKVRVFKSNGEQVSQ